MFSIIRAFVENNGEPIDFKDFITACSYRADGALSLLEEMISKNILKISGTRITLSDIGNTVLPYIKEEISKKENK